MSVYIPKPPAQLLTDTKYTSTNITTVERKVLESISNSNDKYFGKSSEFINFYEHVRRAFIYLPFI